MKATNKTRDIGFGIFFNLFNVSMFMSLYGKKIFKS